MVSGVWSLSEGVMHEVCRVESGKVGLSVHEKLPIEQNFILALSR